MSSNLPPGVTESMIPGNRPQDVEAERYAESLDDADVIGYLLDHEGDFCGFTLYEGAREDGSTVDAWWLELPRGATALARRYKGIADAGPFDTYEEAISYLAAEVDDEVIDEMVVEHLETEPEPDEPDYDGMPGGPDHY